MVLSTPAKLTISSKSENLTQVEKLVEQICATHQVPEDNYGNILVAVTEAVNNALYHGNKANPDKSIDISFEVRDKQVSFTIKDQGDGFDFSNIPDPTDPLNIEKPHGRGVFLMKSLAERVTFEEQGSKVILEFNLVNPN
jgi:serine/threonine-protein kinase RsbW